MNIGEVIVKLRKERKMTQNELGIEMNVTYQAVSKWEKGLSTPDFETIIKLADFFDVSIYEFVDRSNEIKDLSDNNDLLRGEELDHYLNGIDTKALTEKNNFIIISIVSIISSILSVILCNFIFSYENNSFAYKVIELSIVGYIIFTTVFQNCYKNFIKDLFNFSISISWSLPIDICFLLYILLWIITRPLCILISLVLLFISLLLSGIYFPVNLIKIIKNKGEFK